MSLNLYSYFRMPIEHPTMDDGFVDFGVPFKLYAYGGFAGQSIILWRGLLINLLLTLCVSIILGWMAEKMFRSRFKLP